MGHVLVHRRCRAGEGSGVAAELTRIGFGDWLGTFSKDSLTAAQDHWQLTSDHDVDASEFVRVWSRQDCEDLIALLERVRERLP